MSAKSIVVRVAGATLALGSATLLAVATHALLVIGTCSSTGYSADYGPVPVCPPETVWWAAGLIGGILGCLGGAVLASSGGLIFTGIFGAVGAGMLWRLLEPGLSTREKVMGTIFGGAFALVGVFSAVIAIRSRGASDEDSAEHEASPETPSPPAEPATPAPGTLSDEVARLAKLHEQGALTDEEFAKAKARLLD